MTQVLIKQQQEKAVQLSMAEAEGAKPQQQWQPSLLLARPAPQQKLPPAVAAARPAGSPAACLTLALPLPGWAR